MFFQLLDRISRAYGWVIKGLTAIAIALLVPMMFLIAGDVIGRYIFKAPIPSVFEIESNFLMVLVVFFPLAYVHRHKEHVFVTLFTDKLPIRAKASLDILSVAIGIVSFGLIGWYGLDVAIKATQVKDTIPGIVDIPVWISKWFIPIGSFAFCMELLIDGVRLAGTVITGRTG